MEVPEEPFKIDWSSERNRLSPYVKGQGGVALIEYRGVASASSQFNTVLKAWHAAIDPRSFSIRIDPEWFTTRTLDDIIFELERKLAGFGYLFEHAVSEALNIAAGNSIGGNATITLTNVSIDNDISSRVQFRKARTNAVVAALKGFLQSGRCMIVVHHHKPKDMNMFWRHLWNEHLQELVNIGLFLVQFHDLDSKHARHADAAAPTLRILLPVNATDPARSVEIYDDLVNIFVSQGLNAERSSEAANTIISVSDDSIALLHTNVAKRLLSLAQDRA